MIDYDVAPAMGAPTAAPLYYVALVFSRFAQGGTGLAENVFWKLEPR